MVLKTFVIYINKCALHLSYIYGRVETAASIHHNVCSEDSVVASQTVYLHLRARRTGSEVQITALLITDTIPFSFSWSEMMVAIIMKMGRKKVILLLIKLTMQGIFIHIKKRQLFRVNPVAMVINNYDCLLIA